MTRLKIEKWVDNSRFSQGVEMLLGDAIKCYKAEAYRAALLFSYLGFMTALKEFWQQKNPLTFPKTQLNGREYLLN
jgi:hypothetical protein